MGYRTPRESIESAGSFLRQTQINSTDIRIAFSTAVGAGAAANAQFNADITQPVNAVSQYEIITYHPSTFTDLTVKVFNRETPMAGSTAVRFALLTSFSVAKKQTVSGTTVACCAALVDGLFNGGNARLVYSNDTAISAGKGTTGSVRIRESK